MPKAQFATVPNGLTKPILKCSPGLPFCTVKAILFQPAKTEKTRVTIG